MTTLKELKKLFVGGVAALMVVAAVACSGASDSADPTVVQEPTTEQVSVPARPVGPGDPHVHRRKNVA